MSVYYTWTCVFNCIICTDKILMWVGNICIIFVPKNILNLNVIKHIEPLQKCFYFLWYICLHYIFTLHNVIRNLLFHTEPDAVSSNCLYCWQNTFSDLCFAKIPPTALIAMQCTCYEAGKCENKLYKVCTLMYTYELFLRQIYCFYIHNTSSIILYLHSEIQQPVLKFILNPSTYTIHQSQFGIIIQKFNNFL